jgi:hypothetical protein
LLRSPPTNLARMKCNSASLIVPFKPSSSLSLKSAGEYTPSPSAISVPVNAHRSSSRCQSAEHRASREVSSARIRPT